MAKRFTDSDKWKKPFIRGLQGAYKVLWLYMNDECDHAGIWQVDIEVARIKTGCHDITERGAIESFGDAIIVIDSYRWYMPDFVAFQYGELDPNNRVHASVLTIHADAGLIKKKPLRSPLKGAKDKDKDKDKDSDKAWADNECPYSERAREVWTALCQTAKWKKKELPALELSLKKLMAFPEPFAIHLMETAISNGYQGVVFPGTDIEFEKWQRVRPSTGEPSDFIKAGPQLENYSNVVEYERALEKFKTGRNWQ